VLKNIRLQSGRSVITMEGRVDNFMNLYYTAPEKDAAYLGDTQPAVIPGRIFRVF